MDHLQKIVQPTLLLITVIASTIADSIKPTIIFAVIIFFAIMLDCLSAYDLGRRLKKQGKDVVGKFQSRYALKMFKTLFQVYGVIVLLHLIDEVLLSRMPYLNLSNIASAVFCFMEVWSILENLSSGNGAPWAKVLQKVMIDKTIRHLNVDITDNKTKENEQKKD